MNGVEFVETFFGAAKVGLVNVPLNWRLVADELEFILSDSGVRILVYSVEFSEAAAELRAQMVGMEHLRVEGVGAEVAEASVGAFAAGFDDVEEAESAWVVKHQPTAALEVDQHVVVTAFVAGLQIDQRHAR